MFRKEFVRKVASDLKGNNMTKRVSVQRHVFHLSDEEGNVKDFVIKNKDKNVEYTIDDVEAIVDACIAVIKKALSKGDTISIRGLGSLGLSYRKPRSVIHPETDERVDVPGRYLPKFTPFNELKICARLFQESLKEKIVPIEDDIFEIEEIEEVE